MLRLAFAFVLALAAGGTASAADKSVPRHGWHRAVMLPAGLPRPHYRFRTTISYDRQPVPRLSVYETPAVLYAPGYDGGSYVPYWDRLPYACGVYGYCR